MARVQFTFTFTNAQPGAEVNFGETGPVFSSASDTTADGPRLVLDSANTVTVWSDSATLTATTVDGRGEPISATATKTNPTVTTDSGTAGTSPFGSGTSSTSMSTTKLSAVEALAFTVTAGTDLAHISFTGGAITEGEDYWGTPGSALPLGVTVNGDGDAVLPDEDKRYDLVLNVTMTCAVADAGKWVGLRVPGYLRGTSTVWSKVPANGVAYVDLEWSDSTFVGDGPGAFACAIYGTYLSVDATAAARLIVTQR